MNPRIPLILFPSMSRIARLGLAIALFWVLEWTFHYTSLSWLHFSGFTQASFIGIKALWIGMVLGCLAQTIIELLLLAGSAVFPRLKKWAGYLAYGPEAGVLAITAIMFIDNISYTFFKVGLTTLPTEAVPWYRMAAGSTLLGIWCYAAYTESISSLAAKKIRVGSCGVLLAVGAILCLYPWVEEPVPDTGLPLGTVAKTRPNILLISIDGVESEFMSAYGYEKDTTPFLKSLASKMTVFTNHYTNNCCTLGSLVSMWTGQTPLEHGVVYPPAVLSPERATRHLPGMLRQLGYTTHQIGDEFFANSFKAGLRHAFHTVNFKPLTKVSGGKNPYRMWPGAFTESELVLLSAAHDRISRHLRLIKGSVLVPFSNFSVPVTDEELTKTFIPSPESRDARTISQAKDLMSITQGPWFIHLHMMGTHGPWQPANDVFIRGMQKGVEDQNLYLGSLLDADRDLARLLQSYQDILETSIVIVTSDHNRFWDTRRPVPLMIHLPKQVTSKKVADLTQSTDLAPTILTAIGVNPPQWMSGQDLIRPKSSSPLILSVLAVDNVCDEFGCHLKTLWKERSLGIRQLIWRACDRLVTFDVNGTITSEDDQLTGERVRPCDRTPRSEEIASFLQSSLNGDRSTQLRF